MRLLRKLVLKFVMMVFMAVLMGAGLKQGMPYVMQAAGMPGGAAFSSDESDLMSTVFQSALRLFSGQASRTELAGELSDKLYAGRAESGSMAELGIELVKPGGGAATPGGGAGGALLPPGVSAPGATPEGKVAKAAPGVGAPGGSAPGTGRGPAGGSPTERLAGAVRTDLLGQVWQQAKTYRVELGLVPVMFLGMVLVQRIRGRRSGADDFVAGDLAIQTPTDADPFEMKHAVHALGAEEFELLVALVYQRQGYRISMSAALSGGRGGDFHLVRKGERLLVQTKKLSQEHRIPVERVRELQEAMTAASAPRGLYVASCGFTWDARNFAKANGITLINARTLDELLIVAREQPGEDLLAVAQWVPRLLAKVQLTTPHCPTCEAEMAQLNVSAGSVWVCSQRPDCRGRRSARKHHRPAAAAARPAELPAEGVPT